VHVNDVIGEICCLSVWHRGECSTVGVHWFLGESLIASAKISPNSTWLVTARHDSTRSTSPFLYSLHVERVESCVTRVVTWRAKWNLGYTEVVIRAVCTADAKWATAACF